MRGIKKPAQIEGMNLPTYKKRLKVALGDLITASQTALNEVQPTPIISFAIIKEIAFEDGKSRMVYILDLSSAWVKHCKHLRKEGGSLILGACKIQGAEIIFDIKRKIKFQLSAIRKENKGLRYENIFDSLNLTINFSELGVQDENIDSVTGKGVIPDDRLGIRIKDLIDAYKQIDEEDEPAQMAKLAEIDNLLNQEITSLRNSEELEYRIEKLEKVQRFVSKEIALIEEELVEEAWADYTLFKQEESGFSTTEKLLEIKEMESLYLKWASIFKNSGNQQYVGKMADLKNKIAAIKENHLLHKSQEDQFDQADLENEAVEKISLASIKKLVTDFKSLPKEEIDKRMPAILELIRDIAIWEKENTPVKKDIAAKLKNLNDKLIEERDWIVSMEKSIVVEAENDFADFINRLKDNIDNTTEIQEEINEMAFFYKRWSTTFKVVGEKQFKSRMAKLKENIEVQEERLAEVVPHTRDLDDLMAKIDGFTETDEITQGIQSLRKLMAEFPS